MIRKHVLILCLGMACLTFGFSQNHPNRLTVHDPQRGIWTEVQGSIDEATAVVHPKGLFMEVGLFLEFSAHGHGYTQEDTLEVVLDFNLPEEAIITDSWLWVEDNIIRADLIDRWTATQIYEDIVDRRQDPSILYKENDGEFHLRIFPMAGNESRKVKLTYLIPTEWASGYVRAVLPTPILGTSQRSTPLNLIVWPQEEWGLPNVEGQDLEFETLTHPELGIGYRTTLDANLNQSAQYLTLESPMRDGVYLSTYRSGNTDYYQLALLPEEALDLHPKRKLVVLLDFELNNSQVGQQWLIDQLRELLYSELEPQDSFNLILSQLELQPASETWLPADEMTIEGVFDALQADDLTSYSNLFPLLVEGINFIKNNGGKGDVILFSNTDMQGNLTANNQRIDDLVELVTHDISVNVLDYQTRNRRTHWLGNKTFQGNSYFYQNITRQTGGEYKHAPEGTFNTNARHIFQVLSGRIPAFDFHTSLDNGFCYARQNIDEETLIPALKRPILQVGKMQGDFPFNIEMAGEFEGVPFGETFRLDSSAIYTADSLTQEIWTGTYLRHLENQTANNETISEIINLSLKERILSLYTAFLALEPSQGGEICTQCEDDDVIVQTTEVQQDTLFTLKALPNPFREQTTLEMHSAKELNLSTMTFAVYDALGQQVRTFAPSDWQQQPNGNFQLTWNVKNSLSSGLYFFVASHTKQRATLKLVLLE